MRTESSAYNFICLMIGGIPHQLASGSVHFRPCLSSTAHELLAPGATGHVHSGLCTTSGGSLWHDPDYFYTMGKGVPGRLCATGTASSSELHRKGTQGHVKYIPLNPNRTAPTQLLLSSLQDCHSYATKRRGVTGSTSEVRETVVLTDHS